MEFYSFEIFVMDDIMWTGIKHCKCKESQILSDCDKCFGG